MGKIKAGILSPVSGKIGGVVGGKWKDKAYLRSFVIPANPNSAGQQTQRGLFGRAVDFAKPIVGPIFNEYTDKFQPKMSGFNFFIKRNITLFTVSPTYSGVKATEGKLYFPTSVSASFGASPGQLRLSWDTGLGSNGRDADKVFAFAYNATKKVYGFMSSPVARSTGEGYINIAWSASDVIHVYSFASQYDAGILAMISNSTYSLGVYSV